VADDGDDNVVPFNGVTTLDSTPEQFVRGLLHHIKGQDTAQAVIAVVLHSKGPMVLHSSTCDYERAVAMLAAGSLYATQKFLEHCQGDTGDEQPPDPKAA